MNLRFLFLLIFNFFKLSSCVCDIGTLTIEDFGLDYNYSTDGIIPDEYGTSLFVTDHICFDHGVVCKNSTLVFIYVIGDNFAYDMMLRGFVWFFNVIPLGNETNCSNVDIIIDTSVSAAYEGIENPEIIWSPNTSFVRNDVMEEHLRFDFIEYSKERRIKFYMEVENEELLFSCGVRYCLMLGFQYVPFYFYFNTFLLVYGMLVFPLTFIFCCCCFFVTFLGAGGKCKGSEKEKPSDSFLYRFGPLSISVFLNFLIVILKIIQVGCLVAVLIIDINYVLLVNIICGVVIEIINSFSFTFQNIRARIEFEFNCFDLFFALNGFIEEIFSITISILLFSRIIPDYLAIPFVVFDIILVLISIDNIVYDLIVQRMEIREKLKKSNPEGKLEKLCLKCNFKIGKFPFFLIIAFILIVIGLIFCFLHFITIFVMADYGDSINWMTVVFYIVLFFIIKLQLLLFDQAKMINCCSLLLRWVFITFLFPSEVYFTFVLEYRMTAGYNYGISMLNYAIIWIVTFTVISFCIVTCCFCYSNSLGEKYKSLRMFREISEEKKVSSSKKKRAISDQEMKSIPNNKVNANLVSQETPIQPVLQMNPSPVYSQQPVTQGMNVVPVLQPVIQGMNTQQVVQQVPQGMNVAPVYSQQHVTQGMNVAPVYTVYSQPVNQ